VLEVIVFVGLQGAGKTTFYNERFAETHALVSMDRLGNRSGKRARQARALDALLRDGRSVVVDNTNPSLEDRAPILAAAHAHRGHCVAYYFDATTAECLERNDKRMGKQRVPPVAIFATRTKLVPPSIDEGFVAVYRVII
jgi:predicted kinase